MDLNIDPENTSVAAGPVAAVMTQVGGQTVGVRVETGVSTASPAPGRVLGFENVRRLFITVSWNVESKIARTAMGLTLNRPISPGEPRPVPVTARQTVPATRA